MKTTVSLYDFRREFAQCRPDNFSYEGLSILFEYLEELGDSCGEELELDVIAICCDYSHDSADGIAGLYDIDISDCDDDEKAETVRDWLSEHTTLVGETSTGFVYVSSF